MIEVMFAVRKDGFKDHPIIPDGLDLVEEEDQFTHMLPLEDDYNPDDILSKYEAEMSSPVCFLDLLLFHKKDLSSFLVILLFLQMCSRWILILWKMRRSTKHLKKVNKSS